MTAISLSSVQGAEQGRENVNLAKMKLCLGFPNPWL